MNEPPISTTSRTRSAIRGSFRTAMAMFVSGPIGTRVISPGADITMSTITSTACSGTGRTDGSPHSWPSSPPLPWMSSAVKSGRTSGAAQPAATGTSWMPASVHTRKALSVVSARGWFPATVVIAASETSGVPCASRIAIASSWPGSQSRMIRLVKR